MNTVDFSNAQLTPETIEKVMGHISAIEEFLSFTKTLENKEIRGMFKEGHVLSPFVDLAYQVSKSHPGILPTVFQVAEFQRQYELARSLGLIDARISKLASASSSTLRILRSQVLSKSLEIYSVVKLNWTKVPGLNIVMDEMRSFFKRSRIKAKAILDKIK